MLPAVLITSDLNAPKSVDDLLGADLLSRLDRLTVLSRKLFAGKLPGERRSKRRGQSVEFDDYRAYAHGDDLRHVDWNVFARFDRFVLKLFREEEDQTLHLILDGSASMLAGGGGVSKLLAGARLVASLAAIGLMQQNRVVVTVLGAPGAPGQGSRTLMPLRGRRNIRRVLEFLLDGVAVCTRTLPRVDLVEEMRRVCAARQGQGVAVLVSDLLIEEGLESVLSYLVGTRGFDASCLQVLAPSELDPTLDRERGLIGDLRLTDIETGRGAEATISKALIERYKQKFDQHMARCERACLAREIVHVLVRSDQDPAELLLRTLRQKRLLG